ncbi:MAG: ABC transporter ATP-binding protein [Verrucomicrobiales bacterium]|nr:ABC transporter ATP-binding protein [Verrucomicrobiales bacterium]
MITCEQLSRRFRGPDREIAALDNVSFSIERGEFAVIKGASGSGKSTLLLALGGMQRPTQGRVVLDGQEVYALAPDARNRLRAQSIGFVFQLFHLVPYLNVRENVVAGLPDGAHRADAQRRTDALLESLGLSARARHLPGTLSAGERQRTALARALVKQPAVILADEPTGNLDPANAAEVFQHLDAFRRNGGTVVVVTHGDDAARFAQRTLRLDAGRLIDSGTPTSTPS